MGRCWALPSWPCSHWQFPKVMISCNGYSKRIALRSPDIAANMKNDVEGKQLHGVVETTPSSQYDLRDEKRTHQDSHRLALARFQPFWISTIQYFYQANPLLRLMRWYGQFIIYTRTQNIDIYSMCMYIYIYIYHIHSSTVFSD